LAGGDIGHFHLGEGGGWGNIKRKKREKKRKWGRTRKILRRQRGNGKQKGEIYAKGRGKKGV
jgi:hypothetical protein